MSLGSPQITPAISAWAFKKQPKDFPSKALKRRSKPEMYSDRNTQPQGLLAKGQFVCAAGCAEGALLEVG